MAAARLHAAPDPLPSWNEGPVKQSVVSFVSNVLREASATYVPPAERVAVFDNDGTLWVEQPAYAQAYFGMERVRALAPQHPEWKDREPFKSALTGDMKGMLATGVPGLNELMAGVGAGLTVEEFHRQVSDWLASSRHPRLKCPYTDCVYQPMLELLRLLQASGFKTYVVSGGELEFMRPWTEKVYGIPPEQVIGSIVETQIEMRGGKPVLVRQAQLQLVNDGTTKVLSIQRVTGRRPIAAFGNSDGDLPMLQWTAAGGGPHLCLYVHHTDAEREWAYDLPSVIGRLDKGLAEARAKGWTVVDMKRDWKRVFPFQKR